MGYPQLRAALPFEAGPTFLIFDRDSKFSLEVAAAVLSLNVRPIRISIEALGQMELLRRRVWFASDSSHALAVCIIATNPLLKPVVSGAA
jgi:hypothetical protein